jgi:hypothetical protein
LLSTLADAIFEEIAAFVCVELSRETGTSVQMRNKRKGYLIQYLHVTYHPLPNSLLCPDLLQLSGNVCEVVRVRLGNELANVGLLDEVLVALLVSEVDGIILRLELQAVAVHEVSRRGPSHERVLPAVALGKYVPVHEPVL